MGGRERGVGGREREGWGERERGGGDGREGGRGCYAWTEYEEERNDMRRVLGCT